MRNLKRALSLGLTATMISGLMVMGSSAASYADVTSENHQEAIEVLQSVGIMTGDEKGNFNPEAKLTRNEMAVVMSNLLAAYDNIDGVIGQDGVQEGILRAYENAGIPYPETMLADFVAGFLNKWATDAPDMNCMVAAYPPSVGYNALYIVAYMMNGRELKDGVLQPNSLDESLVNTIYVQTPYIITKEKATGDESWLEGIDISQTELISLEEAIEILDGAATTTAITKNWSEEIIESFFEPVS